MINFYQESLVEWSILFDGVKRGFIKQNADGTYLVDIGSRVDYTNPNSLDDIQTDLIERFGRG